MAYKRGGNKGGDSKYLRLTGLWPSKSNDSLFTGRMKADQLSDLFERVEEAQETDAPLIFSLWVNDKKESRKDPEFTLQCFVGDAEEQPRSNRGGGYKKRERDDNDDNNNNDSDDNQDDGDDQEDDKKSRKSGSSKRTRESERSKKSKRDSW